jgi:ubiquinone/menaquinone biosynthesis C-methylase UbiE
MAAQMFKPLQFISLIIRQNTSPQKLRRIPEPEALLDDPQQVKDYEELSSLPIILTYAMAIRQIQKIWRGPNPARILDLACGPGHFTLLMSRVFPEAQIIGIDLAANMIASSNRNMSQLGRAGFCQFQIGDITQLDSIQTASMDLVTCTNAAHHLPDLNAVGQMISEMERVAAPSGLVAIYDSARLKSEDVSLSYVNVVGKELLERGLNVFYEDFKNSLLASWTVAELRSAVPDSSTRVWYQLVPFGLPATQILIGLPLGEKALYPPCLKSEKSKTYSLPIPAIYSEEWKALCLSFALGRASQL